MNMKLCLKLGFDVCVLNIKAPKAVFWRIRVYTQKINFLIVRFIGIEERGKREEKSSDT